MRELPIPQFLGLEVPKGSLSESDLRAFQEQQLQEAEEITVSCMNSKGWDYEPRRIRFIDPGLDSSETPGTRAWVSKYGFGISTLAFSQDAVGPELVGFQPIAPNVEVDDPNDEYVASLDPEAAEAYRVDLVGENPRFDSLDADSPAVRAGTGSFGGCRGEANDATGLSLGSRYEQELTALTRQVHADQRVVSFVAEIERCVVEMGHPFYGMPIGLNGDIPYVGELQSIGELAGAAKQEDGSNIAEPSEQPAVQMGPEARRALAELQAREVREALAVYDCGGTAEAFKKVVDAVTPSYERSWIASNREQLLELRDRMADIRDRYGLPPLGN